MHVNPETWWYVARATGIVAYALLAISVVTGLLIATRLLGRRPPPDWVLDWHRFVGALSLVFTVLHLVSIWLDDYVAFGIDDLVVPFASSWRPVGVAFGVVALYLATAVEVTSLARTRLPHRWWRTVHHLSIPAFGFATVHLLMTGADADDPAVLALVGAAAGVVVLLLAFWPTRRPHPTIDATDG